MIAWIARLGLAVALFCAGLAAAVPVAAADPWRANEDDALLLELRHGSFRLGEPLRGYQTDQQVCLDLADVIQALDLPVRLDKPAGRLSGWVFAEQRTLVIDRAAGTATVMGERRPLEPGEIVDTPEGWCASLSALSRWLGVGLRGDLGNLAVVIESAHQLPFLEALQRKSRAARLRPDQRGPDPRQLPRAVVPYRPWRGPAVDWQIEARASRGHGAELAYEALAGGEVLGMSYAARLAAHDRLAPQSLRVRLFRHDPDAALLGPLRATQIALGDVETPRAALSAQASYGRGAFIANRPLNLPARFDTTTLRGTLPAGWDAELYRNGVLRAYHPDRGDGRYEFSDVALQFGENTFEVVLYGPQGQVRRERSNQMVGPASLPAGQTWYWGGVIDEGRDLAVLDRHRHQPGPGWRWGGGIERGLDARTTVGLGYHSLVRAGQRQHYGEALVRRALGPWLVELAAARQTRAGRALRGELFGRLGGVHVNASYLATSGTFESDLVAPGLRREAGLRLSGVARLGGWQLPLEAGWRETRSQRGVTVREAALRGSSRIGRAAVTAELMQRAVRGPPDLLGGEDHGARVNLIGSGQLGPVRLRGSAGFGLGGSLPGLQHSQLVADVPLGLHSALRAGHDFNRAAQRHDYSLGYVHQFAAVALRGEARMDSRGGIGAGLTLAFSLGRDPAGAGWRLSRERLAATGRATVDVFRDDNGDGLRQPDEPPVSGVQVAAGFRSAAAPTDSAGRTVLDGLMPDAPVVVAIDRASLPDPLLQPRGAGVVLVPRPGVAAAVSLPVAPTGEIEGLLLGPDGEPRGAIGLELVDCAGQVVRQGQSDFDGYVLFDLVPYGEYRLRLTAAAAQALGAQPDLGITVQLGRDQPLVRLGRIRPRPAGLPRDLARAD